MFSPPSMGYDRAITIFSPDGRLYQVEYALEAVKRGLTTIGILCTDGVVLLAERRKFSPLLDEMTIEKIVKIDDHIGVAYAGLGPDARVLIDMARNDAQIHRLLYDEPIPPETLIRRICDIKQNYTLYAGARPFGVAFLVAGIDGNRPVLMGTEPGGAYAGYKAHVLGAGSQVAQEILEKELANKTLPLKEGIKFGIQVLKKAVERELTPAEIEAATVDVYTKKFKRLTLEEIKQYL
ncbi:MAG: archaeal proteasome endopeptidase complex subunit alpha [Thermoproteota archaeon]